MGVLAEKDDTSQPYIGDVVVFTRYKSLTSLASFKPCHAM